MISRKILAISMIALLLLLTSINFFIYSSDVTVKESFVLQADAPANDIPEETGCQPTGPDEKTPDRPVSISEEFLHEHQDTETPLSNILIHHLLLVYGKVHPVHFDLITPPPDLLS